MSRRYSPRVARRRFQQNLLGELISQGGIQGSRGCYVELEAENRACVGKVQHTTRGATEEARRLGWPYRAYACQFCGWAHVGRPGKMAA